MSDGQGTEDHLATYTDDPEKFGRDAGRPALMSVSEDASVRFNLHHVCSPLAHNCSLGTSSKSRREPRA